MTDRSRETAFRVARYLTDATGTERPALCLRIERIEEEMAPLAAHLGFRPRLPRANESARPRDWRPSYTDADAALVAERLVDLDEGFQEWRYRHVKMVERTIGTKRGTGGSSGVEYLRETLFRPAFPDLWEIRSRL